MPDEHLVGGNELPAVQTSAVVSSAAAGHWYLSSSSLEHSSDTHINVELNHNINLDLNNSFCILINKYNPHTVQFCVFIEISKLLSRVTYSQISFCARGIYAIARICYRPSVCQSVGHMGGSVKNAWS